MLRGLVALSLLATVASPAFAQGETTSPEFFPYAVGDRWRYEVKGTTPIGDTVDAEVEWRVERVWRSPTIDTLWITVTRQNRAGGKEEATCRIERTRGQSSFLYVRPPERLCKSSGGFPFGNGLTTSYPFLDNLSPAGVGEFKVGDEGYRGETATALFRNEYQSPPRPPFLASTTFSHVQLVDGLGIVQTTVIEHESNWNTSPRVFSHRDTLRAVLTGAQVGGQFYGRLQPVAAEPAGTSERLRMTVGPNPTRGDANAWITGASGRRVHLQVFDTQGRLVRTFEGQAGEAVPLHLGRFPPGLYLLRAETDREVVHGRLTVVR